MRAILLGALLISFPAGQALAQALDVATIDQLTAKAMKHLTINTRYAFSEQAYGDIEFGKKFGTESVSSSFGETSGLLRSTVIRYNPKSEEKFGLWENGDQLVFTKPGEKGGTVIHRQHGAWVSKSEAEHFGHFAAHMGLGHCFFPPSALKYGISRNLDSAPGAGVPDPRHTFTVTEETHRGRACYKVVQMPNSSGSASKPVPTEYHIDKDHGMVLARRQKGMLHIPKGARAAVQLDVDQVTEITYGPPQADTGLPFPTAVKGSFVWPTGRKEPMTDVEFTEFRRYTPTADELDFEKQFGTALPALPPRPAGSKAAAGGGGRTKWWLLGGVGVAAAAVAAVVVVRRRRAR